MASDDNMNAMGAGNDRMPVVLVYALYLLGLLSAGGASIVGVIIAHLKVGSAVGMWRGHYQYQIRTFWLGVLTGIVAFFTLFILIGWVIGVWLAIWTAIRTIKGLMRALNDEPLDNPETLLW